MTTRKSHKASRKVLPNNCIKITHFHNAIRVRAIRRGLSIAEVFDPAGNVSCAGDVFTQDVPEVLVEYNIHCNKDNIQSLIKNKVLRKHHSSTYSLCIDFYLRFNQTFITTLSKAQRTIERQLHLNSRRYGYDLDAKLVTTTQPLKEVLTLQSPKKSHTPYKPMSGSPKGLDRVEPWMNSSNLETKPFEGGKCSPR